MLLVEMNATMDAVRAYLRELRIGRNVSQDELGEVIGLSRQALNEWEKGRTYDLKGSALLKAVEYLHGTLADLGVLAHSTIETGIRLARQRLASPDVVVQKEVNEFTLQVSEFVDEEDVKEVIGILQQLHDDELKRAWFNFGRFLKRNDPES